MSLGRGLLSCNLLGITFPSFLLRSPYLSQSNDKGNVSSLPMRLSLFSDYSLRVLLFGALKEAAFPLHEVADSYGISRHHLVKVVNHLTKLGYLATRRGRGGGIELAMKPEDIRIGGLVRRTESSVPLIECFHLPTNTCPIAGACRLKGILAQAVGTFYATLDQYTLADISSGPERAALKAILLHSERAPPSAHVQTSEPDSPDLDLDPPVSLTLARAG